MVLTNEEMKNAAEKAGLKVGVSIKVDIREKEEGRGGFIMCRQ